MYTGHEELALIGWLRKRSNGLSLLHHVSITGSLRQYRTERDPQNECIGSNQSLSASVFVRKLYTTSQRPPRLESFYGHVEIARR
jgi:hypothetical protein